MRHKYLREDRTARSMTKGKGWAFNIRFKALEKEANYRDDDLFH
jgi:hypothetical protein